MSRRIEPKKHTSRKSWTRVVAFALLLFGASLTAQQFADALHGCGSCWVGVLIGMVAFAFGLTMLLRVAGTGSGRGKR